MQIYNLRKLKSGTDIRGIALGDDKTVTLTNEAIDKICRAFATWLAQKKGGTKLRIAVGNDSRLSANRIQKIVASALQSCGVDVIYTGLSSTPSMFILLKQSDFGCDGSIMITASHLPYDRNGLKFFSLDGGLESEDIDKILTIAENEEFLSGNGRYLERSFMDGYCQILVESVEKSCGVQPLKGKKIIVDAGNGAGGFFADKVLKVLGADTSGSLFLDPDGRFPNHIPNPEDKTAIDCLSKQVTSVKADLGIIFDTDVDRAACVDKNGKAINRNELIALLAVVLKDEGGTIVTDSVTSDGLRTFLDQLGFKQLRFKRGYKNVINKCKQLNDNGEHSPLAIETSGHAAFKDNYYLDDGAYLITKILICLSNLESGTSLSNLISGLVRPVESDEIRLSFSNLSVDYRKEGDELIEKLTGIFKTIPTATLAEDNFEGVRVNFAKGYGNGWTLVRKSLHDPVIPINFESNSIGGNRIMAKSLLKILLAFPFIDTENLKNFIG